MDADLRNWRLKLRVGVPVESSELFAVAAETAALGQVGLERVVDLFGDRVTRSTRRGATTVSIAVGEVELVLVRDRHGEIRSARVDHVVAGVRLKSSTVSLGDWVYEALTAYDSIAKTKEEERDRLREILGI